MSRKLAREKIMQCLFAVSVGKNQPEEALAILDEEDIAAKDRVFINNYLTGVLTHLEEIDAFYSGYLKDWQLERLANLDMTLLRMATYEMYYLKDIPPIVSINEAIELAKVFGTDDSPKFINAVLDNLNKKLAKEEAKSRDAEVPGD